MKKKKFVLTEEEKTQLSRHLSKRFCELLREMNISDKHFLINTGINERLFYRFKEGGNPGLHTISLFAKALGVELKELFEFNLKVKLVRRHDFKNDVDWYDYLNNKRRK